MAATVEECVTLDLGLILRRGWAKDGEISRGVLLWASLDSTANMTAGYLSNMTVKRDAHLILVLTRIGEGQRSKTFEQRVELTSTSPTYGGRRWWFVCPITGRRACKLHLPAEADLFASRDAWNLRHRSQRISRRYRPFEKMFRLQRKLGGQEGWGFGVARPKGMRLKTFEGHLARLKQLDRECVAEEGRFMN